MLLTALCATSCRSKQTLTTAKTLQADTVCIVSEHVDTCVLFAPDSALLDALFACDSLGNVYLAQISALQGQRVSIAPLVRYVETDNGRAMALKATAVADSLSVQLHITRRQLIAAQKALSEQQRTSTKKTPVAQYYLLAFAIGMFVGALAVGIVAYRVRVKCNE